MSTPTTQNHSVLIVEDEISIRTALADRLRREGFIVLEAPDGEAGLTSARDLHPALIILDVMMPKMDGMAMLMALRHEGGWAQTVPVIVLTNLGSDDAEHTREIKEDPATDYYLKSNISLRDIVTIVRSKLTPPS